MEMKALKLLFSLCVLMDNGGELYEMTKLAQWRLINLNFSRWYTDRTSIVPCYA